MKSKPNVDDFLNAGDASNQANKTATAAKTLLKRSKLVQLPVDLLLAVKQAAINESMKTNSNVSETAIIEAALRAYIFK